MSRECAAHLLAPVRVCIFKCKDVKKSKKNGKYIAERATDPHAYISVLLMLLCDTHADLRCVRCECDVCSISCSRFHSCLAALQAIIRLATVFDWTVIVCVSNLCMKFTFMGAAHANNRDKTIFTHIKYARLLSFRNEHAVAVMRSL